MGKTIIKEDMFPKIIEQYNSGGKAAAYDLIQGRYGLKNPYFIMRRIKKCRKYMYEPDMDQFTDARVSASDSVFMDLNELCGTVCRQNAGTGRCSARQPAGGDGKTDT